MPLSCNLDGISMNIQEENSAHRVKSEREQTFSTTSLLQPLLQNLVGNSGETQRLEETSRGKCHVPKPPLQIVKSIPFCLFSL